MTSTYKTTITEDDIAMVKAYAEGTAITYNSNGRDHSQIVDNIFVGKIGEVGFAKIFNCSEPTFEAHADPGYDFVIGNFKIDVKTLDEDYKRRVYITSLRADIYAVVMFDKYKNEVKYIGNLSTLYIKKKFLWNQSFVLKRDFEDHFVPIFKKGNKL